MRILFISGVDVGGAPRSTLELALRLDQRGHSVGLILGRDANLSGLPSLLINASIKARLMTGWLWPREALKLFARRGSRATYVDGVWVWRCSQGSLALTRILRRFEPDVVVANSLPREQMLWVARDTQKAGLPVALYMREEHAITHLTMSRVPVDVVLANSQHLARAARGAGYSSVFIPSVVNVAAADVTSTRRVALLINPIPENRPEVLLELATKRSDIECVLQESWPLATAVREKIELWANGLPNLSFRNRQSSPADIYRDAKVLIAPYPSGRPRVVLEAQHNGIPVVGLAQPALAESIGDGGVLVHDGATTEEWVKPIEALWDDAHLYEVLVDKALSHAGRNDVDSNEITINFENALKAVIR